MRGRKVIVFKMLSEFRCGPNERNSFKRVVRFCAVGALVLALDLCLVYFLSRILSPTPAVTISYLIAVNAHFWLNRMWVFEAKTPISALEFIRYGSAVLLCLGCTISTVWVVLHFISSKILIAKAIAVPPTTLLSFLLMRAFVFRQS